MENTIATTKKCNQCLKEKALTDFSTNRGRLRRQCKECRNAYGRAYRRTAEWATSVERLQHLVPKPVERAGFRTCNKCSQDKPLDDFAKDKNGPNGYRRVCHSCMAAQRATYAAANRAKLKVRHASWRKRNPEKMKALGHRARVKRYGLTIEEYGAMLVAQNGCCAICGDKLDGKLDIDHDHAAGKVRGLLCRSCNVALGLFGEDPNLLEKAIEYLKNAN